MKRTTIMLGLAVVALALAGCATSKNAEEPVSNIAFFARTTGEHPDKSADSELQELIASVKPGFARGSYTDEETGLTVPYNIYLPSDYDASKSYPMVVFIGDATTAGTDMDYPLTQGWGGLVWAGGNQDDGCIILNPVYPDVVIDDHDAYTVTDYVNLTPRLIAAVAGMYSVDMDRIYGTGQSMGAMTTLYLASNYPDLYAAVLIVDGQWPVDQLPEVASQRIIYVAAGGDEKAAAGQEELKQYLTEKGVTYGEISDVDAQADRATLNDQVQAMLDEGNAINFITWASGTVMQGVSSNITSEHMASFDYGYKLSAVRNWILSQTK
ncbi:MAG: alpha/beta hydrolase-fold protein [Sphaerochaetaceae bacterium]|nr:alpha/beta hydrolase-fold protein [Spirochaetales bacterium]MDY5498880.1 alpha/beta hydrolase-fold protein [Sphaerochaetaceae bacterium]